MGRRFRVVAEVTISVHTDVEAETEEQAKELAGQRGMMHLCWSCSSESASDQWVTSGELDGDPGDPVEIIELPADESPKRGRHG